MSALGGLQRPSLDSLTPRFVDREEIPAAAALSMLRGSVGMIAGPALAGTLIAGLGLAATYAADLLSYVLSLLAFRVIRAVPPPEGAPGPSLAGVLEGIRYATSRQELVGHVRRGLRGHGLRHAARPLPGDRRRAGRAADPRPALRRARGRRARREPHEPLDARVHRHGRAVLVAAALWGLAIVAFGACDRLAPALAFLGLAGAADAVSGLFRMTIWNQTIPDDLRGRLASLEIVSYTSGPLLGHAEAGAAAALGGVRFSVVSGGILCVVGVVVCALVLPGFVAYDARGRRGP